MNLTELELINYCQYENRKFSLYPGLGVLTARNGGGKSNLLNAVFLGLTGESSIEGKTKSKMLRWGSKKGKVILRFSNDGINYSVDRSLHAPTVSMVSSEGLELTSITEVNAFLQTMTGVNADILLLSCFMPQKGAMRLVFGSDVERMKEYSRLFQLSKLEKVREAIHRRVLALPRGVDFSADIEDIRSRIPSIDHMLEVCRETLEVSTAMLKELDQKLDSCTGMTIKEWQRKRLELQVKFEECREKIKLLESNLAGLGPEVVLTAAEISSYESYKRMVVVGTKLDELSRQLKELPETSAVTKIPVEELEKLRTKTIVFGARQTAYLTGKCPVCESDVERNCAKAGANEDLVNTCRRGLEVAEEHDAKAVAAERANMKTRVMRDNLTGQMKDLEREGTKISTMLEKCGFVLKSYQRKSKNAEKFAAATPQRVKWTQELAQEKTNEQVVLNTLTEHERTPYDPDSHGIDVLKEQRRVLREEVLPKLHTTLAEKSKEREMLLRDEKTKGALTRQYHVRAEQKTLLDRIRDVLHVDNFPRALVLEYCQKLSALINKYLANFKQPFAVEVNDSLAVVCQFPDNSEVSVHDLSGGQQMIITIASRLAISEMLGSRVNLVVMDEPTNHLDSDSRAGLINTFGDIRRYLQATHTQMLVSSHDDQIQDVADYIIPL